MTLDPSLGHIHQEEKTLKQKTMMAPVRFTEQQMKWIESEAARTGNSMAAVVRGLVQKAAEKKQ